MTASNSGPATSRYNRECYMCGEEGHFMLDCEHFKRFMKLGWLVPAGDGRVKLKNNMKLPWKEANGPQRYVLIKRIVKSNGWDRPESFFTNLEEEDEYEMACQLSGSGQTVVESLMNKIDSLADRFANLNQERLQQEDAVYNQSLTEQEK